jgi:hypothetical protein
MPLESQHGAGLEIGDAGLDLGACQLRLIALVLVVPYEEVVLVLVIRRFW